MHQAKVRYGFLITYHYTIFFLKQDQNISSIRCSSWRDKSFKRMYSHFCTRNPNRKLQCHQFHEYMELGEQKCEEGPRKHETPGNSEVSRSSSETRGCHVLRRTDQKYRFDMNQARLNFHFDIGHPLAGSLMISMSILMESESLNSLKDHNLEFHIKRTLDMDDLKIFIDPTIPRPDILSLTSWNSVSRRPISK